MENRFIKELEINRKMGSNTFDRNFERLYTNMAEIAFEFVNRNKNEVDKVYVFASMEADSLFYNVFYRIHELPTELHQVNNLLIAKCDISNSRINDLLRQGTDFLEEVLDLFENDNREVPTLMKMTYEPKTGAFNNDISYELNYSNHKDKTIVDVFKEWFEREKQV
ncbi:immunity protein YezG family protein [Labilibaculum manganireducens]|uniref:immunity protein YezG family protein n=1 Tax=Labilibaculum manganireducens TaxID=1940525 RepID=UPI0029F4C2E5|nr:hypothetical protein [Labilibaculum manganireducens]